MDLRDYLFHEEPGITLYCGDARDVLPLLKRSAALVTDPPYGVSGSSGTINAGRAKAAYGGAWSDDLAAVRTVFVPAVRAALALTERGAITPGGPHCFEYPKPDDIAAIIQPASVGMSKWGRATWQPVLLYGRDPRLGLTIQALTITSNGRFYPSAHPCPKPDDVARWMVDRVTEDGDEILDPFAGSGTFLRAAKDLGRNAIGIEIEPRYCEIAVKRLRQEVLPMTTPPTGAARR